MLQLWQTHVRYVKYQFELFTVNSKGSKHPQVRLERRQSTGVPGVKRAPVVKPDLDEILKVLELSIPQPFAIEALWNGDTFGWFVNVRAIFNAPRAELHAYTDRHLATFSNEKGDARVFTGQAPPWQEAEEAAYWGARVAERLGIPFWFPSKGAPDDRVPRWWDVQRIVHPLRKTAYTCLNRSTQS